MTENSIPLDGSAQADDLKTPRSVVRIPLSVSIVVIIGALLTATGAALIQLVDVIDDLARGAFLLVPGLLVFAIVFLVGASRLFGQAVWRVDTWREPGSHSPESR
jgi:hypothetical protein